MDAFAGTGIIRQKTTELGEDEPTARLLKGSARAIRQSFDQFVFIEKSVTRMAELEALKGNAPSPERVSIIQGDANERLLAFVDTEWNTRAPIGEGFMLQYRCACFGLTEDALLIHC